MALSRDGDGITFPYGTCFLDKSLQDKTISFYMVSNEKIIVGDNCLVIPLGLSLLE